MKKGQLQIQETILVVFVFIVIILIALVFFYRFQMQAIQQDMRDYERESLDILLLTLPSSSALSCSQLGKKDDCLDTYKLLAFQKLSRRDTALFSQYPYLNVTVFSLYPVSSPSLCSPSSFNDCGVWSVYSRLPDDRSLLDDKTRLETPISLYYPDREDYGIGKLVIEVYGS